MAPPRRRPPGAPPPARKRFGQHFLVDQTVLSDIAERVDARPGDVVLEIGPGRGALTAPLLSRLTRLVAVEVDRDLCALLRQRFPVELALPAPTAPAPAAAAETTPESVAIDGGRLRLLEADVLRLDLPRLLQEEGGAALVVIANLPYNITAPVLMRLREHAGLVRRAVLTLQLEVAERLVAAAGSRTYGQLSVLLGQCARIRLGRRIPNTAFKPQPKVDSAVLEIDFLPNRIPVADLAVFERVVRAAFGQRRKMLRNTLRALPAPDGNGTVDAQTLAAWAAAAEIDLTLRAEALSVGQFARLADVIAAGPAAPEAR